MPSPTEGALGSKAGTELAAPGLTYGWVLTGASQWAWRGAAVKGCAGQANDRPGGRALAAHLWPIRRGNAVRTGVEHSTERPMLRYRADVKTLIFVTIYFALVAAQW